MKQLEAIHCHHSFICGTKICTAIVGHEYWLFNMQNPMWVLGFTMSLPFNDVVEGVRCFAGSELFALEPFRTICFYEQFKLDAKTARNSECRTRRRRKLSCWDGGCLWWQRGTIASWVLR
jgi:hypothetical protein